MSEQDDNLERVSKRIASAIYEFFAWRVRTDQLEFHAEDMRRWVIRTVGMVAPGSPDRVMRDLKQKGFIYYDNVDRPNSLYRIELKPPPPPLQFDSDGQSFFA
jgi:hypothetical protein